MTDQKKSSLIQATAIGLSIGISHAVVRNTTEKHGFWIAVLIGSLFAAGVAALVAVTLNRFLKRDPPPQP